MREQRVTPLTADTLAANLNEWFPWARWACFGAGRYRIVSATRLMGVWTEVGVGVRGKATERVARCLTWENARNAAKAWAWKQPEMRVKEAGDE